MRHSQTSQKHMFGPEQKTKYAKIEQLESTQIYGCMSLIHRAVGHSGSYPSFGLPLTQPRRGLQRCSCTRSAEGPYAKKPWQKMATVRRMRPLTLTMFLHSGFSEVSVSFRFSSASSSSVSLTCWFCSSPQKPMTSLLHKPGLSGFSVMEEGTAMKRKMLGDCVHVCRQSAHYPLCS